MFVKENIELTEFFDKKGSQFVRTVEQYEEMFKNCNLEIIYEKQQTYSDRKVCKINTWVLKPIQRTWEGWGK